MVLVEVLSPATADLDKGQEPDGYVLPPSVREVGLADGTRRRARVYRRVEGGRFVSDAIGRGGIGNGALSGEATLDELCADTPIRAAAPA